MIIIFISFFVILFICRSKKPIEKKPSEPEKVKPVEVKPTPSPLKPEEPAPNPVAQKETPKVEPVKEKSKKASEKTHDHESSKRDSYGEIDHQWIDKFMEIKCTDVVAEYVKNFSDPKTDKCPPCKEFDSHPELNRYKDVKCLDKSRVIIKNGKSDYIHASWVQIPKYERKFILAQSPMNNTVDDFWQMCVENEVKYIVMLCLFVEGGEEQSCQYFPEGEGEKQKYGNVEVELDKKKQHPIDGVIWNVLNVEVLKKNNSKSVINQIMVPWWPDKCAPEDPELTAKLIWWLKKRINPKDSPMVVHCNNGIGRSATFVAISLLRFHVAGNIEAKMVDFIKLLREMRFGAIETEEQYVFIHTCIFEYFNLSTEKHYMGLWDTDDYDRFEKQFKEYAQKKMEARKAEKKREKSLKVEPTKEDNCSMEEVKNPKSQKSEGKKEKSSKEKPIEKA